ncbi:melatonin receptor type 1A-like [Oculina patagonica]
MTNDLGSRSPALVILEGSSLVVLNIFSLTGNILVCLSVYRNPRLRTSTNLYIIALAISDLLSAVFVMPPAETILFSGKWPFGETICQLHAFISLFVIYVSPATMSLTAVNRYVRICRSSTTYKKIFSHRKSRLWLAFVWFFVACYIAVPRLANWQGFEFVPGYAQCSIKHLGEQGKLFHYIIVLTLFLVVPLFATAFCYSKVFKTIRQHKMGVLPSLSQRRRNEARITVQEIKLSRSLFIVVFAFMSCWVPLCVIVILRRFFTTIYMPRNVELMCMFFLYISNTINPVIYSGMNSAFRSEFRRIVTCRSSGSISSQCLQRRNSQPAVELGLVTSWLRGTRVKVLYQDGLVGEALQTAPLRNSTQTQNTNYLHIPTTN